MRPLSDDEATVMETAAESFLAARWLRSEAGRLRQSLYEMPDDHPLRRLTAALARDLDRHRERYDEVLVDSSDFLLELGIEIRDELGPYLVDRGWPPAIP